MLGIGIGIKNKVTKIIAENKNGTKYRVQGAGSVFLVP